MLYVIKFYKFSYCISCFLLLLFIKPLNYLIFVKSYQLDKNSLLKPLEHIELSQIEKVDSLISNISRVPKMELDFLIIYLSLKQHPHPYFELLLHNSRWVRHSNKTTQFCFHILNLLDLQLGMEF